MRNNLKYCLRIKLELRQLRRELAEHEKQDALTQLQTLANNRKTKEQVADLEKIYESVKKFGFIWW